MRLQDLFETRKAVAEGAPELLKAEMPLVRHIEKELTQHGYEKGTAEYNEHFKHALAYYRKFGNVDAIKQGVAEGKITLSTDPSWYGATVDNYQASGPVVNIPANQLVGFEPDDKMNQPKSKVNVEKIVAGLKQGAKLPPLLVRKYKNGYQVLDGHHRFWAYKLLGVKSIPAQIVPAEDYDDKEGVAEGEGSKSSPYEQGGTDAWYHRGFDPKAHGYEPGTEEYREYKRGFDYNDFGPEGGKRLEELTVPAPVSGAAKVVGKKLPLIAVPLGAYDAYQRGKAGDWTGAGLAAGSMIGGIPHPATIAASLGLDAIQALRDKARTGEYFPDEPKIAAAVAKDKAKQTATPADKWSDVPTDQWQAKDDKQGITVHSPIKIGTDDEDDEDEALIDKSLKENSELDRIRYYVKYTG